MARVLESVKEVGLLASEQGYPDVMQKPDCTFIDLGCGAGKAVFAAALLHRFGACIGVELLEVSGSSSSVRLLRML